MIDMLSSLFRRLPGSATATVIKQRLQTHQASDHLPIRMGFLGFCLITQISMWPSFQGVKLAKSLDSLLESNSFQSIIVLIHYSSDIRQTSLHMQQPFHLHYHLNLLFLVSAPTCAAARDSFRMYHAVQQWKGNKSEPRRVTVACERKHDASS